MTIEEILFAAKQLPVDDRKLIVQELNESLPEDDELFTLSPEWTAEIQRRVAEMDAHPEKSRPWPQVRDELMAEISSHVEK